PPPPPDPPAVAPERLSETGLYENGDVVAGMIAADNMPFEPQYPLWTDGAEKARWIHLPKGARIDARDTGYWVFPVGTKLWKHFAWNGRNVETRLLWRARPSQWVFATYVWNEEQTEAFLAPASGIRNHYQVRPGAAHSIPGVADCVGCHEAGGTPVLGFNALQLSDDRDPLAPHGRPLPEGALTNKGLHQRDLLYPRRPDLVRHPPRLKARSPRESAALGYLSTNCGSCHNERGPLAALGMHLQYSPYTRKYEPEVGWSTAVGVNGHYVPPGASPLDVRRIRPGSVEASAIVYRMSSRRPASQMPPIGTAIVDGEGLGLVKAWIGEDLK
ncbi:MAG TPA: hypothetical protein VGF40_17755, partial [Thermoanaerobaculia bacterium]